MKTLFWVVYILVALGLAGYSYGKGGMPKWLENEDKFESGEYAKDSNSIVLHDEKIYRVEPSGRIRITGRYAVRILDRADAKQAIAKVRLYSDTDALKSMRAWMRTSKGKVLKYGRNYIVEIGDTDDDTLKSSLVNKVIVASRDAVAGSVFAYEYELWDNSIQSQVPWQLQGDLPIQLSKISFDLPEGWSVRDRFFNMKDQLEVRKVGDNSWQLTRVPAFENERLAPNPVKTIPWGSFDLVAPRDSEATDRRKGFKDWREFSSHYAIGNFAQTEISNEIRAEVDRIVEGKESEWDRIEAIAKFAQSINYVSINLNLGSGGGAKPRPPDEVLKTMYGDCKDKAQLMRQMLSVIGIPSYPLVVSSGNDGFMLDDWISPVQFDHCILAVETGERPEEHAFANVETGESLLIFDPTDEVTVFGDLRKSLQGGKGVLIAESGASIVELPNLSSSRNTVERDIDLVLDDRGNLKGSLLEKSQGQQAVGEIFARTQIERGADYSSWIRRWVGNYIPNVSVSEVSAAEAKDDGSFVCSFDLEAPAYAKLMGGRLLMFKPIVLNRLNDVPIEEREPRKHPIEASAYNLSERIRIRCPNGFSLSEIPEDLVLEAEFGRCEIRYTYHEGLLEISRIQNFRKSELSSSQAEEFVDYFRKLLRKENEPVVLEKI